MTVFNESMMRTLKETIDAGKGTVQQHKTAIVLVEALEKKLPEQAKQVESFSLVEKLDYLLEEFVDACYPDYHKAIIEI